MSTTATCLEDAYRVQTARIAELERENAELNATLDTIISADERAVKAWRAAHPGQELVIPDRGKLVGWLLEQNDALRQALADMPTCRCGLSTDEQCPLSVENAALRELVVTLGAPNHINVPIKRWRELRADKERLDWIAQNRSVSATERPLAVTPESLRAAIDAARKEAQP